MKVRLVASIEIDKETWELVYGEKATPENVRNYVMGYIHGSAAAEEGAIVNAWDKTPQPKGK